MTRSRLICLAGALLGFAGFGVGDFHWPAELLRYSAMLKAVGIGTVLVGVRGVNKALRDRRIDAALRDIDHAV